MKETGMDGQEILDSVINMRYDKTESTPLIRACHYGNLPTTKYLLEELSARSDITNKNDENCLMVAVRNRHNDIIQYLCKT